VDTIRLEFAVLPEESLTLAGSKDMVGGFRLGTTTINERVMLPENPLRLVSVIIELPLEPAWSASEDGLADTPKLGDAPGITTSETATKCDIELLIPFILIT
jgi:hypothetical protein